MDTIFIVTIVILAIDVICLGSEAKRLTEEKEEMRITHEECYGEWNRREEQLRNTVSSLEKKMTYYERTLFVLSELYNSKIKKEMVVFNEREKQAQWVASIILSILEDPDEQEKLLGNDLLVKFYEMQPEDIKELIPTDIVNNLYGAVGIS